VLTGIGLLVACKQPAVDNDPSDLALAERRDTTKKAPKYCEFRLKDHVCLPGELSDSISKLIPVCDAEFGLSGRTYTDALDMNIVQNSLYEACGNGGHVVGITYFDDFWFDDKLIVSVNTEYDQNTLVLREHEGDHWHYYTANVKIDYSVYVDGTTRKGTMYDSIAIQTNLELLEQP
jgi:hypothetical protein